MTPCNSPYTVSYMTVIRTGLTHEEWAKIQEMAEREDISAKKLVTDAIRKVLLTTEKAA